MPRPITIQILSDLHLENHVNPYNNPPPSIPKTAPYLALLGDIGNTNDANLYKYLDELLKSYEIIFYILGNHEPYGSTWTEAKANIQRYAAAHPGTETEGRFILLDQTRYDFPDSGVTVLGVTLFSRILPDQHLFISRYMPDFGGYVGDWRVEQHNQAHVSDVEWLNTQVESIAHENSLVINNNSQTPINASDKPPQSRKVIILTHHNPTTNPSSLDPKFANSPISSAFSSDLSREPCWTDPNVCMWAFGHTHFNCDFLDNGGGTSKWVVTNQMGYSDKEGKGFDVARVFLLGVGGEEASSSEVS